MMTQSEAIKVVQEWGRKHNCPGTLETMQQMRDEIMKRSELITLKDQDAYNIFIAGMRRLFHGPVDEEEEAA